MEGLIFGILRYIMNGRVGGSSTDPMKRKFDTEINCHDTSS